MSNIFSDSQHMAQSQHNETTCACLCSLPKCSNEAQEKDNQVVLGDKPDKISLKKIIETQITETDYFFKKSLSQKTLGTKKCHTKRSERNNVKDDIMICKKEVSGEILKENSKQNSRISLRSHKNGLSNLRFVKRAYKKQ